MGTTQLETVPEPKYWHLKTVLSEALDSEFAVGEIDASLDHLHEAFDERSPTLMALQLPYWDAVRSDDRFVALINNMRIPGSDLPTGKV